MKVARIGAYLDYIISTITLSTTSCISVVTIGTYSNYIKVANTTTVTSHIKIVVTRANINISSNNCITVNKNTRKAITNYAYNRESNKDSILSIIGTNKLDYSIDI
jgi:hypothetical protein